MVTVRQDGSPTHRLVVGVLVWDDAGRVLLLRPLDVREPGLPGGPIDPGESPARAGVRRVAEATGQQVQLGLLLVVEHVDAHGDAPPGVHLVFDSTPSVAHSAPVLHASETVEAQWLTPFDAVRRHGSRGRARISAAFAARRIGTTRYLDSDTVRHDRPRATPGLSV